MDARAACVSPPAKPVKVEAMEEVAPGVRRWTATHPNTGNESSCHWAVEADAVIDPLLPPDGGLDAFRERPPKQVLLSNRHHIRDSERFVEEFESLIRCSRPGMHEFEDGPAVEPFDFGEEVAPGIEAIEIGAICPDETALLIRPARALLVADGVRNDGGDGLSFFPDRLLGDDPEGVKRGLREAYRGVLDRDFDTLLFAHGEPIRGDAKEVLEAFCQE
jgi:hypothetical protein